jgi:hypothetical protein
VTRRSGSVLISSLVEADGFDEAVGELARRLTSGPVHVYAQTKAQLTKEQDMSHSATVELEAMTQALLMKGQDYAAFHAAFNAAAAGRGAKACCEQREPPAAIGTVLPGARKPPRTLPSWLPSALVTSIQMTVEAEPGTLPMGRISRSV